MLINLPPIIISGFIVVTLLCLIVLYRLNQFFKAYQQQLASTTDNNATWLTQLGEFQLKLEQAFNQNRETLDKHQTEGKNI